MIREIRRGDAPRLFELMRRNFPEESALLGERPDEYEKVIRRVFRWDTRFLLGILRLAGRPIFRLLVVEADRTVVAGTLVTYPPRSAYVSNVVVDPAYRRRGYAKRMLDVARESARRAGRRYIALDVLDTNRPARTLYGSLGFQRLRATTHLVLEDPAGRGVGPVGPGAGVRPFHRSDAGALTALARQQMPAAVAEVLPIGERAFAGSALTARILASEEAAWVLDRGHGPEGYVAANVSATSAAAHLTAPVVSEALDPATVDALGRTAVAWCAVRRAPRILCMVTEHNTWGRAAVERLGFQNAYGSETLYRPVG